MKDCSQAIPADFQGGFFVICSQGEGVHKHRTIQFVKSESAKVIARASQNFIKLEEGMVGATKCAKPKAIENGRKVVVVCFKPSAEEGKGKYMINFFKYDKNNYDVKSGQPLEIHTVVDLKDHEFVIDAFSVPTEAGHEHPRSRDYPMITHVYIRNAGTKKESFSAVYAKLEEERWDPALVDHPPRIHHSDIADFPTDQILSIDSDSRNLLIATISEEKKTTNIVVCSIANPEHRRCGKPLAVDAFTKHEDSEVEPRVSVNREHPFDDLLNVIVFDTHRVIYYELLILENGVDIEFDFNVHKIEYDFQRPMNFKTPIRGIKKHGRLYLIGERADGTPHISLVFIEHQNKIELSEKEFHTSGDLHFEYSGNQDNTDKLFYFAGDSIHVDQITTPAIILSGPAQHAEGKQLTEDILERCHVTPVYHDGVVTEEQQKHLEKSFSVSVLDKYEGQPSLRVEKVTAAYEQSYVNVPVFQKEFSGNSLSFEIKVKDEKKQHIKPMVLYNNELKLSYRSGGAVGPTGRLLQVDGDDEDDDDDRFSEDTKKVGGHEEVLLTKSIDWVGGHHYTRNEGGQTILMKCAREPDNFVDMEIHCADRINISKDEISKSDSFSLLDGTQGNEYIYLLFDIRHEGKPVDGDHNAALALVKKTDDSTAYSIHKVHLIKEAIDVASLQFFKNQIFMYGSHTGIREHMIYTFSMIESVAHEAELEVKITHPVSEFHICPNQIHFFPPEQDAVMIVSHCVDSDKDSRKKVFHLNFNRKKTTHLRIKDVYLIDSLKKPQACLTDSHIHIFETAEDVPISSISYSTIKNDRSEFSYPVSLISGIKNIHKVSCDYQRNMVHLLATQEKGEHNLVVSLNAYPHMDPHKRVHSVAQVHKDMVHIASGYSPMEFETLVFIGSKDTSVDNKFILIQPNAPRLFFDAVKHTLPEGSKEKDIVEFELVMHYGNDKKIEPVTAEIQFSKYFERVEILPHQKENEPVLVSLKPDDEEVFSNLIDMEQSFKVHGPITGISYKSFEGNEDNEFKARLTEMKGLPSFGKDIIGMKSDHSGKYTLVWTKSYAQYFVNRERAGPRIKGRVRSCAVVHSRIKVTEKHHDTLAAIAIDLDGKQKLVVVHNLGGDPTKWLAATSNNSIGPFMEKINVQHVGDENSRMFTLIGINNFFSPRVVYNGFKIDAENDVINFMPEYTYEHSYDEKIHDFTSVNFKDNYVITAVLSGNTKGINFSLETFDSKNPYGPRFSEVASQHIDLVSDANDEGEPEVFFDHSTSKIVCQKIDKNLEHAAIECFIPTAGVYSFFGNVDFNDFHTIKKEYTSVKDHESRTPLIKKKEKVEGRDYTYSTLTSIYQNFPSYTPVRAFTYGMYGVAVFKHQLSSAIKPIENFKIDDKMTLHPLNSNIMIAIYRLRESDSTTPFAYVSGYDLDWQDLDTDQQSMVYPQVLKVDDKETLAINNYKGEQQRWELSPIEFRVKDYREVSLAKDKVYIHAFNPTKQSRVVLKDLFKNNFQDPGTILQDAIRMEEERRAEEKIRQENELERIRNEKERVRQENLRLASEEKRLATISEIEKLTKTNHELQKQLKEAIAAHSVKNAVLQHATHNEKTHHHSDKVENEIKKEEEHLREDREKADEIKKENLNEDEKLVKKEHLDQKDIKELGKELKHEDDTIASLRKKIDNNEYLIWNAQGVLKELKSIVADLRAHDDIRRESKTDSTMPEEWRRKFNEWDEDQKKAHREYNIMKKWHEEAKIAESNRVESEKKRIRQEKKRNGEPVDDEDSSSKSSSTSKSNKLVHKKKKTSSLIIYAILLSLLMVGIVIGIASFYMLNRKEISSPRDVFHDEGMGDALANNSHSQYSNL